MGVPPLQAPLLHQIRASGPRANPRLVDSCLRGEHEWLLMTMSNWHELAGGAVPVLLALTGAGFRKRLRASSCHLIHRPSYTLARHGSRIYQPRPEQGNREHGFFSIVSTMSLESERGFLLGRLLSQCSREMTLVVGVTLADYISAW